MTPTVGALEGVVTAIAGASIAAVWQGALLVMVVGVCLRVLGGLSARVRWSMWLVTFLAAALLPVVALLHAGAAEAGQHGGGMIVGSRWAIWMGAVWAGLSLYRTVRLVREFLRMQGIAGRAEALQRVLPEAASAGEAGSDLPEICCSAEVAVPCVAGLVAPRILLPPGLVETGTDAELRQIVLHESEHLRRHDLWVNLVQKLALALFPLNPALLWVDRRLAREREMACDDEVLRATGARKAYATCLANLAETALLGNRASLALGAWARRSELARRVARILAQPRQELGRFGSAVVACSITAGLAVATAGLSRVPPVVGFRGDVATPVAAPVAQSGSERTRMPFVRTNPRWDNEDNRGAITHAETVTLTSAEMPARRPGVAVLRSRPVVSARTRRKPSTPLMRQIAWPYDRMGDRQGWFGTGPYRRGLDGQGLGGRGSGGRGLARARVAAVTVPVMWREAGPDGGSEVRQPVLLSSPDLRFTYAAVPVQDGWLFVQL